MPNLDLKRKKDLSIFRQLALGTWETSYDSQVYGTIELEMDRAQEYIDRFREKTGKRLTVTHLVAKAVAETLRRYPSANAVLRFGRIYLRKRIGVFMQVAMTDDDTKPDLSGMTVFDIPDKSLVQLIDEIEGKVAAVRSRQDPVLEKSRNLLAMLPGVAINPTLKLLSLLTIGLNLDLGFLGVPKDPFGSVMVTNIGSLGLDAAFPPLVPYTRVPILLAIGRVKDTPVVREGEVVIRKVLKVNATFDHRFIDGYHAAMMSRILRDWLENPDEHFDPI